MAVAFRRIILPPENCRVFTGQSVTVLAETIDATYVAALLAPTHSVVVSIFDPLGAVKVNDLAMNVYQKGVHAYTYRIPFNAPLGLYTGNFTSVNNNDVARLERVALWRTVKTSNPSDISYLFIKDQDGVVWYWYLDLANQIVSLPVLPEFLIKDTVALLPTEVYWLEIPNSLEEARYLRPDVTGSPEVVTGEPLAGAGSNSNLVWLSENGSEHSLSINIVDEIVITEV